jgi:hypothetical protein
MEKEKKLDVVLNKFIDETNQETEETCTSEECKIKTDKSLLERINKKIIVEDGRQLLF